MSNAKKIADIIGSYGISHLGYLPCNQLTPLMEILQNGREVWHLTRESAGVPISFGFNIAGGKSAMLIQSTGLGNLITETMTMPELYRVPMPILTSWRGHYKENIEAQIILGGKLVAMLESLEIQTTVIDRAEDLEKLKEGMDACYEQSRAHVFMLSPELWEEEVVETTPAVGAPSFPAQSVEAPAYTGTPTLGRFDAIKTMMESVAEDEIVLPQIGYPAREAYSVKDRENNFYLLGALGSASLVGLGIALAKPDKKVTVYDGDGAFIFNPNQFLELAQNFPKNLRVVVLDNGSWGSTGSQPTLTSKGLSLPLVGQACGLKNWKQIDSADGWNALSGDDQLIHFMIKPGNAKVGTIHHTAVEIKNRVFG